MKKILSALLVGLVLLASCGENFTYEAVANDPLKARIYTLDNGLKVYMTVYKDAPRIQTYIAVHVGGKNDPAETTGLAHYFEHLMFKGTSHFGSSDYEEEKPLLDEIENLFEVYRTKTDPAERKALYKQIDSVSNLAAKFAIANEYDKLMSAIGATGTNAYTSNDATVYIEDIPSNELESWAKIQADRFSNPVIRLFHTELETVYEEKNMSLTNDMRKVSEAMFAAFFLHHPYGTQTVLGTQEHLKNPSIINIKKYFNTYYVPNNMAICMSGDFNPDEAIKVINKHFGTLKKKDLPEFKAAPEQPIVKPIEKTVLGPDAESVMIGFRLEGPSSKDADLITLADMIIANGHAGLMDLNVNQKQLLLNASAGVWTLSDYQIFLMQARPKQGQTLKQAQKILLAQLDSLKKGAFSDWLLKAVVTDLKLQTIKEMERNDYRADAFVDAFVNGEDWKSKVDELDRLSKITKEQLVEFANRQFGDGYVVVYKRTGKDPNELKIEKPEITPIQVNRDAESKFLTAIKSSNVKPIEPVFLDFSKDLSILKAQSDIEVLYKQNEENELFELLYVFNMGKNNDKELALAVSYLPYLGTDKYTAAQLKEEFYKLGCAFNVFSSDMRIYVTLNGLSENMKPSLELFEHLLANAQVNKDTYKNLANDVLKARTDAKLNQRANFSALSSYTMWGAQSPATNILSGAQLAQMNPQVLVDKIHGLTGYKHNVFYYGPVKQDELLATLAQYHKVPQRLKDVPAEIKFVEQPTNEHKVLFAQYEAKQIQMSMLAKLGSYDKDLQPIISLYNEYFGGSMNAIVFQEMREARGLAYSAYATYNNPSRLDRSCYMRAFIATQNDKMADAIDAFNAILNDMPESQKSFDLAKEGIISRMRTERTTKDAILWHYDAARRLGLDYDIRRDIFTKVPTFTMEDMKSFQQQNIKNLTYTYSILGDEKALDMNKMQSYGKVTKLSQKEIFGY
ncbi:MAG: insulinase family protein [Prevotellaceae bacterium]|jgi:predicted Zn-dependent peptidase|nr:insulinase family protein [Prevotellaceae bacterium]